jgi:hypothetical protein
MRYVVVNAINMLLEDGCVEISVPNNLKGNNPSKNVQATGRKSSPGVPIILWAIRFMHAANNAPAKYTNPLRSWLKTLAIKRKNAIREGAINDINWNMLDNDQAIIFNIYYYYLLNMFTSVCPHSLRLGSQYP